MRPLRPRARFLGRIALARVRRRPAILMYHRIAAPAVDPFGMCVTPDRFRRHLEVLRASRRPVLPLAEMARRHETGDVPRDAIAITFDDGYADNLTAAAPALAALDLPATVFVTTGLLGAPHTWWDRLAELVLLGGDGPDAIEVRTGEQTRSVELGAALDRATAASWRYAPAPSGIPRADAFRSLWQILLGATREDRDLALDELAAALGEPPAPSAGRLLTADEVVRLEREAPVEIGSHTVTHASLTRVDHRRRVAEVEGARDALRDLLGHDIESFAYPHGHVDSDIADCSRRAGHRYAVTTEGRSVRHDDDIMRLPRFTVLDWPAGKLRQQALSWGW